MHSTQFVRLSFRWYAFWWIAILGVHLVATAYNAAFVAFYWHFGDTFLSYTLESDKIGLPRDHFHTLAYVYMGLVIIHGQLALSMVIGSLRYHKLTFSVGGSKINMHRNRVSPNTKPESTGGEQTTNSCCAFKFVQYLSVLYHKIAARGGLLGVDGKYFHVVIICRELLQETLQTVQAFRMSKHLPRPLLNRFYVSLVAVNCWSTLFVSSRWFWKDEARRRFAVIGCDILLDLMSTLGIQLIIVLHYWDLFHIEILAFNFDSLGDEAWGAQMLNEVQMVIVVSWFDLASRAIFSVGLIASTADMKALLRTTHSERNRVASMLKNLASVVPPLLFAMKEVTPPYSNASVRTNSGDARGIIQATRHLMYKKQDRTPIKLRLLKVVHILIAAWGIVLIALHVNASIRTPLSECATKVHPMAGVLPSCYVVNFNCAELGISGSKVDVSKRWSKFDRATAQTLRLLHCSALEFPTSFNEFSGLIQIEIYNSTIVNWDHDNAITKTSHPDMTVLYLIRVNMTDGLLPPGLQSLDFPPGLSQIYFCETNLLAFPDDLDAKWPPGLGLYVENSQLAEIPLSLARLRPLYLIAGGNPITQIPAELFEAVLTYLTLGSTKLTELPQYVMAPSTTIYYLDVTNTEVSFFWSWIDALVEDMFGVMPLVAAGGTPYCSALSKALNGNSENFGAPFQDGYSPILMNASQQNWDLLYQAVDCSTNAGVTQFPLEWWDTIYGL